MIQHLFADESLLIDLRFLVGAEVFDFAPDDDEAHPFGIGVLLEVGHTPQRLSALYLTRSQRDAAFTRLIALQQAWLAYTHAPQDDE